MRIGFFVAGLVISAAILSTQGATATAQSKAERIRTLVSKYHEAGLFNGSVLVAEKGKEIYKGGFGDADMSWHVPNTPATRFRIGSVTKQFTAAIVLQLVEEGKLKLDAKVIDYLPDYPKENGSRITIHHLLTHSSGIPNYTDFPNFTTEIMRNAYEPGEFVKLFSSRKLEFDPGSRWSYSNSGYYLLGAIIEKVTGKPYEQVLRERILEPLGLKNTGYSTYESVIDQEATGYVGSAAGYRRAPWLDPSVPYSAGMLYSTVEDLFKWDQALYGEKIFRNPSTKRAMFTAHIQDYGYGWFVADLTLEKRKVKMIEHGGAIFGFITGFRRLPEEGYTVIVMDNTSGPRVTEIVDGITRILYDLPAPDPTLSIARTIGGIIERNGVDAATAKFREIRSGSAAGYDFDENEMNLLGYEYLRRNQIDRAVAIFQMNIEAHPDAFNTYDSMGEALLAAGDSARAITSYRKALELNPASHSARAALVRLGVDLPAESSTTITLPEATLRSYVGNYELAPTFVIAVTYEGGKLMAQATGQKKLELRAVTEKLFNVVSVDAQIVFNPNASGTIESLTLLQNGRSLPGRRVQ